MHRYRKGLFGHRKRAKNELLDTLGGSLWNSTRTGHILPVMGSFATSIARQHKGLYAQVSRGYANWCELNARKMHTFKRHY